MCTYAFIHSCVYSTHSLEYFISSKLSFSCFQDFQSFNTSLFFRFCLQVTCTTIQITRKAGTATQQNMLFCYPNTFTHSTLHLQDFMVKSVLVKYFLFSLYYPTNAVTPVLLSYFFYFCCVWALKNFYVLAEQTKSVSFSFIVSQSCTYIFV